MVFNLNYIVIVGETTERVRIARIENARWDDVFELESDNRENVNKRYRSRNRFDEHMWGMVDEANQCKQYNGKMPLLFNHQCVDS